jgi:hypothetical protein
VGACGLGFPAASALPGGVRPWLKAVILLDFQGFYGLLCPEKEIHSIFGEIGKQSPFDMELQASRLRSMPAFHPKSGAGRLEKGNRS